MTETATNSNSTVKWGAMFIIGLMLLSGVAVFFGSQTTSQNPTTPNTPLQNESFFAEEVQGTIVEVFNTAVVGGQTSDGDKTEIDELLQSLPGVERISSQFSDLSGVGSVTYIANITLATGTDREAFAEAVYALDLFDNPEVYFQASAQVEQEQEVLNSNQQLTRITLPKAQIQAIALPLTQKGDIISGSLAATFNGTNLVSAYILETQNVTASPTPISLSGEYSISTLQPSLAVAGMVDYYPGLSAEQLINEVNELPGVTSTTAPFFPAVNNVLSVEWADSNTWTNDLNTFVSSRPESFSGFFSISNGFAVQLNQVNVNEAKALLENKVNELTASNIVLSFTPPRTQFLLDVNTSSVTNASTAAAISDYFVSVDANSTLEIYQDGTIVVETVSAPDSNAVFAVPNATIPVSVLPGHAEGDVVRLLINAIALRGEIAYITGVESAEE